MKNFVAISAVLVVIIIGSVIIFSNLENEKNEKNEKSEPLEQNKKKEMTPEVKAKLAGIMQGALAKNIKPNFSKKKAGAADSKVIGSFSTEKWSPEKRKEFLESEIKKNMEFFRKGFYKFVIEILKEFLARPENADNVELANQDLSYEIFEQEFQNMEPEFLKLLEDPIAKLGFESIRDELYGKYNYDETTGFPETNREKMMDDFTGNFTDYLGMMAEESVKKSLGSNINFGDLNISPEIRVEVMDSESMKNLNLESGIKIISNDSGSGSNQEELNKLMKELDVQQ